MATILVVDDEQLICDLLASLLTGQGHTVLKASSGEEALEVFRRSRPHLTLVDLLMPGMHGLDVLTKLRAQDATAPVIILTSHTDRNFEERARGRGATAFIEKGLPLDALLQAVGRALPPGSGSPPAQFADRTPSPPNGELILVVDDEPMICNLLEHYLTLKGYRVQTAQNGLDALRLVKQEHPRLIILDMFMPSMSGVEVLRALKTCGYQGRVLTLTGSQDEALLQEAWSLGSVDVLGKPVDLVRLALKVRTTLTAP